MLCQNQEKVSIYGISKLHDNVLSHNSGLIIAICTSVAIATERTLKDAIANNTYPEFKHNKFYFGIETALDKIMLKWH